MSSESAHLILETVRDRALILRQTHRLAYFTDGDYRASRAWVRAIDWIVLLLLAGLEPLWVPNEPVRALAVGCANIAVLIAASIAFEIASPFLDEFEWKRIGKQGTLVLSAFAVCLNTAAALDDHPSTYEFRSLLRSVAVALTFVVGIGSILCLVLLFGMFWYTLLGETVEEESQRLIASEKDVAAERQRRRSRMLEASMLERSNPMVELNSTKTRKSFE